MYGGWVVRFIYHNCVFQTVLFYGANFATDGLPLPRKRNHLWAVFYDESPKDNDCVFQHKEAVDLFNFSATYKRESNYPIPTMMLPSYNYLMDTQYMLLLTEKNRFRGQGLAPVVAVHSNCRVPSDRSNFIKMLRQHIDVDFYGECGDKKVPDM